MTSSSPGANLTILMHSSKTMRTPELARQLWGASGLTTPVLLERAQELGEQVRGLDVPAVASCMKCSTKVAEGAAQLARDWSSDTAAGGPAAWMFTGDLYSGLGADTLDADARTYADAYLRILSGLYGVLAPRDGIHPYRLEMGYSLPGTGPLHRWWGTSIADVVGSHGPIINLTATEYGRVVTSHVEKNLLVTPSFRTLDASGTPKFVAVHAKVARGAFVRWLLQTRPTLDDWTPGTTPSALHDFTELGYRLVDDVPGAPAFVCQEFGGLGLSVRLKS